MDEISLTESDSSDQLSSTESDYVERGNVGRGNVAPFGVKSPAGGVESKRGLIPRIFCGICNLLKKTLMMIPVCIVLGIVSLDFYALMILEMPRRYEKQPTFCTIITLLFVPAIVMLVTSYLRTVFTSSAVADNPPPRHLDTGAVLRCRRCSSLKPIRAHHCSICQKCVLKMDHHCPWVANCVGFSNYKFFCLFLFYTDLSAFIFLFGTASSIGSLFSGTGKSVGVSVMFASILTFAFAITLLLFGGFHASLVLKNCTTLEFGQANRFSEGSAYKNWVTVFGPNPLLWFLPVKTLEGHGGWGWNMRFGNVL